MTLCVCGNCRTLIEAENLVPLEDVKDLNERLTPGSVVPDGECPECGALAYAVNWEENARRRVLDSGGPCMYCGSSPLELTVGPAVFVRENSGRCELKTTTKCGACERSWTDVYAICRVEP